MAGVYSRHRRLVEAEPWPVSALTADAEEDNALYEKLSGEQWRLECLMHLLAELKDSDLPGAFFLFLLQARTTPTHTRKASRVDCEGTGWFVEDVTLSDCPLFLCVPQELTAWASCKEEGNDEEELAVASLTSEAGVDKRDSRVRRIGRVALLQVLAVMVERLHHTVLLRKSTQVSAAVQPPTASVFPQSFSVPFTGCLRWRRSVKTFGTLNRERDRLTAENRSRPDILGAARSLLTSGPIL